MRFVINSIEKFNTVEGKDLLEALMVSFYKLPYDLNEEKLDFIFSVLEKNNHISSLSFNKNLSNLGVKRIIHLLQANKRIKKLTLEDCELNDNVIENLAECLSDNKNLITLKLICNKITVTGIKILTLALQKNSTLQNFELSSLQLGEKWLQYIAQLLLKNETLKALELACSGITENGLKFLSEGLVINQHLTRLNLGGFFSGENPFYKGDGAHWFSEILKNNRSLRAITGVYANQFDEDKIEQIIDALKDNRTLQSLGDEFSPFAVFEFFYEFELKGKEYLKISLNAYLDRNKALANGNFSATVSDKKLIVLYKNNRFHFSSLKDIYRVNDYHSIEKIY